VESHSPLITKHSTTVSDFTSSHQVQSTVFFVESSDGTKTATVTLDSHADVQKLYKLRKGSLKLKDEVLTLDRNFLRFTVLHEGRDPKVE
jgi:hypothetical protein